MFNPWILLGAVGIAIGVYFYGHHEGSLAGDLKVATIQTQMDQATIQFNQQVKDKEEKDRQEVQKQKDLYDKQLKNQAVVNSKLQSTINGLRTNANSYVAQIERLSGQDCTSSNAALELANRQYTDLAEFARQAATRADSSAAIANTLNDYATRIN